MPVSKTRCEYGDVHNECPDCGSDMVTLRDNPELPTPNAVVDYATEETPIEYTHVCWDCGWREQVRITVTRSRE